MNERIEQYLKQHHCEDYFNAYGESVADPHYFMYREEVDGLIELIVRECVNIAYEYDAPKMSGPGMIIAGRIETHFGVGE